MLFTRTYHGLLGGHLKVFDYMRHVAASGAFEPVLYLTPESALVPPRSLLPEGLRIVREPVDAAAYFIAGLNWRLLDEAGVSLSGKPVINLIQNVLHALPGDPRRAFLARPALRICVSPSVERAVRLTGEANGPLVTIPNGIDTEGISRFRPVQKQQRVFVGGAKNAILARAIARDLHSRGIAYDLSCELVPREEFLARMAMCDIAVLLPHPHEGFFLPALEAMVLECAVILPDCEPASSFCVSGSTCLMTASTVDGLCEAVSAVRGDDRLRRHLCEHAALMAAKHSLERERDAFLATLSAKFPTYGGG